MAGHPLWRGGRRAVGQRPDRVPRLGGPDGVFPRPPPGEAVSWPDGRVRDIRPPARAGGVTCRESSPLLRQTGLTLVLLGQTATRGSVLPGRPRVARDGD